jgi:hypothetical protein
LDTLTIVMEQQKGMYAGYKKGNEANLHLKDDNITLLTEKEFYLISMQADLNDLIPAFEQNRVKINSNLKGNLS